MGSFANTVFSFLLGWLRGLISMIWSALTSEGGESFFTFIGNNWIKIAAILCAAGLAADFAVYFFRWQPYKVWKTFLRHIKGKREDAVSEEETGISSEYAGKVFPEAFAEKSGNRYDHEYVSQDYRAETSIREDDLERWRNAEPETEEMLPPAEVTKAGYTVPADSSYRRPAENRRRRRIRVSLLGETEENGEVHYFAPRPIIDQKDAYHAPVYPEKWTGSREQDS